MEISGRFPTVLRQTCSDFDPKSLRHFSRENFSLGEQSIVKISQWSMLQCDVIQNGFVHTRATATFEMN